MFSDTFTGIAPGSAAAFIAAQIVGAAIGLALVVALFPDAAGHADEVVVPHKSISTDDGEVPWLSKPTVLFLCTHNAGRSQMALGFFSHLAGEMAVALLRRL